jgi:hypothetical protein
MVNKPTFFSEINVIYGSEIPAFFSEINLIYVGEIPAFFSQINLIYRIIIVHLLFIFRQKAYNVYFAVG